MQGFTLLEILVVVVIIGILTALLLPNISVGGHWRDLQREANTLATRIQVAQDDAMLYGREYGIEFTETGYDFVVWDNKSRRFVHPIDSDARWLHREFDDDIHVATASDGGEPILVLPEKSAADVAESVDDATTSAETPAEPDPLPSVFVLSSGEVTPFTAVFRAEGEEQSVKLRMDSLGKRIHDDAAQSGAP